ncbi:MAG: FAD-binding oxidoreductase [Chloroflexota bacterium]|nr:FAD-binding oxidoreductase [Chloroflexota bacterium]
MPTTRRKFWGWGPEGDVLSSGEVRWLEGRWARQFGVSQFEYTPPPTENEIHLRPPRLSAPASLLPICTTEQYERLFHSYGYSFLDSVRIFARDFSHPPDVIAYPRNAQDIVNLLDWCNDAGAAVIPFGGGTSVVGGIEPPAGYPAVVTIDMRHMNQVLEVDPVSQTALIQAGASGAELERQLKPSGLTLRFFPQSFEYSTLGGWIATRAGGHFATLYTHIDDLVESLQAVTPIGIMESRRLPASGAGPNPDRMWLGSEGILGIVTQAWVRVGKRPTFRAALPVQFADFFRAVEAVRAISQAGLYPANCRLLDPLEASINGAGDGTHAVLVLTFESADHPLDAWLKRALELCADFGGEFNADTAQQQDAHRSGAAGQWRERFLRMPWYREELTARGIISDTFETAITWERFPALYTAAKEATALAIQEATGRPGSVSCRFTHIYPDGPAAYFTFGGLGHKSALAEQFWTIKKAASAAVMQAGGTITHHHAVGRNHRQWYDQERPAIFATALGAVKSTLDPHWLLNPGVLLDPPAMPM